MHLPFKVFTFKSQSEEWKIKTNGCLDKVSPLGNWGTNPKVLHTPTSTPKKPKGDDGEREKKKKKLDKVFYEKKAWQKANIEFRELLKWKPMFIGKIVKTSGIWHLQQCNLLDWD